MGQQVIHAAVIGRTIFLIFGQLAPVEIMDFHIKTAGALGNRLSDAAHADDAQLLAGDLCAHQMGRTPA